MNIFSAFVLPHSKPQDSHFTESAMINFIHIILNLRAAETHKRFIVYIIP